MGLRKLNEFWKKMDECHGQNLTSENQSICSNPDCNWPESDYMNSCNRYIVQEITIIGEKPSEACPVVTDTVNQRLVVIEDDKELSKLIDNFTKPLGDAVLQMIKSEESIKFGEVEKNEEKTKEPSQNEKKTKQENVPKGEKDAESSVEGIHQ